MKLVRWFRFRHAWLRWLVKGPYRWPGRYLDDRSREIMIDRWFVREPKPGDFGL